MIVTDIRRPAEAPARNPASFRDPSGFVFELDGRIFRAINQSCLETIRALRDNGLLEELADEGVLVRTQIVEDAPLQDMLSEAYPGFPAFLEHQRIDPISYPYEWSTSMLADAGILTLDLQIRLLEQGYSLKDATAYNVQFVNGKPVFIDIPSIEKPPRLDVWIGLGQFNRMFTLPLVLNRSKGQSLRSYFLSEIDGRKLSDIQQAFGRLELLKPSLLLDVTLPYLLERLIHNKKNSTPRRRETRKANAGAQILNLKRLRAKLQRLARGYKPHSIWSNYTTANNYSEEGERSKVESIRGFLSKYAPMSVLDVGCNTGKYSMLAAQAGAEVIAVDADPESAELLYRRVKQDNQPILPLCMDMANPSPAIGFCNRERPSFLDRLDVECVFALAVIHHFHITANLSVAAIRDMLADMTSRFLVLEFVPTDDAMFQRLLEFRVDLFQPFTLNNCIETFRERFTLLHQVPVADSSRTLLFWEKR